MKLWIKRAVVAVMTALGLLLFLRHGKQLLDWPHLYPDLSQLHLRNLIFGGLTLLLGAFAWIAAVYLFFNVEAKPPALVLPAAAFVLLLTLSGLCMTQAVGEIPCSYTSSLAVCREERDPKAFVVRGKTLCLPEPRGELSAYARYEKGEALAESLTVRYDQEHLMAEAGRLEALGLPAFSPADEERCYQLELGDGLWQLLVRNKEKTVTYSRFLHPEQLPGFAPQPVEVKNEE